MGTWCQPARREPDIAFTRLYRQSFPGVDACLDELVTKFEAVGLQCDRQVRATPCGMTTFLSVSGKHGLRFIVDFTLVGGATAGGLPGAALQVRLLDVEGDVQVHCSPHVAGRPASFHDSTTAILASAGCGLASWPCP